MRVLLHVSSLALTLLAAGVLGCGRQTPQAPPQAQAPAETAGVGVQVARGQAQPASLPLGPPVRDTVSPVTPAGWRPVATPAITVELSAQEKYDAAFLDALTLLAEQKHREALAALQTARTIQDTEQVRREISRVNGLIQRQAAAERTVLDIEVVLKEGKPDEAADLVATALGQYGDTPAAATLARLKRQADALLAAQLGDNRARRDRFVREAEVALRERNLRAAAIAYEEALQFGDDPALRRKLDEVKGPLARYDECRQRASELRRDPVNLEEAVASLHEAAKAWDTLQVRQEIDDYSLALQKRRDRLSVADFEVRGDVGIPAAGRTLAEELLPHFKSRFDLAERSQLAKVISELKLQESDLVDNEQGRREVGRLAKVRFLVLGSVTPLGGLTAHARLVDVSTGLVVQTARIVAPTPEELVKQLPQLALMLTMNDDQRIAFERQLVAAAPPPAVVVTAAAPPPPPPAVINQPPPPPIVVYTPRPPGLGGVRPEDFDRLPPPPPPGRPAAVPVVVVAREQPVKQKLFHVAIELGDNLYRRGKHREAFAQFELALQLSPGRQDVLVRLDNCRPHLPPPPPPPVIVVAQPAPPPPPPPRPRLAVLHFVEMGDPAIVPPGLGAWTAENIAPYFCPPYEIADRGEVFWYMGRLGLTVKDVLQDPAAQRWLARAVNARFFLIGTLRQTASFDATTHLIDAEQGCEIGGARIHVHGPQELKLRLAELARLTLLSPDERTRYLRQQQECDALLLQARQCQERNDFTLALGFFNKALGCKPGSVEIQVLIQKTQGRARELELEAARRAEWERQQALIAEAQRRQAELARAAELARIRAEQEAAALAQAERLRRQQQAQLARQQLVTQAQVALKIDNFELSISLFESALNLGRDDNTYRELAVAQARAQEAARARAAQQRAQQEAALRQQREAELVRVRGQVELDRRRRDAEEGTRRQSQEARDQVEYTRLLDLGQRLQAQGKHDEAVAAFQNARQLRKTDEVERLVSQALVQQARASAPQQDAAARAELERRLAQEKARREAAEAEAKRNHDLYTAALRSAQKASSEERYDEAITRYREAEKLYRTDVVLTGLRQAEEGRSRKQAKAREAERKQAEESRKSARFGQLMQEGRTALAAGQHAKAVDSFREATEVSPGNVDALAALKKAEQERDEAIRRVRRREEDQKRAAEARQAEDARKVAEAKQAEDARRREQAKQVAAAEAAKTKQAAEARDREAARKAAEAKQAEDARRRELAKQAAAAEAVKAKQAEEARDRDAARKAIEAKQAKQAADAREREEARKAAEAKQAEDARRRELAKQAVQPKPEAKAPAPMPKRDPTPQAQPTSAPKPQPKAAAPAEPPAEFTRLMQAGAAAEQQKKYGEAIKAYREAAKIAPNEARARAAQRNIDVAQHLAAGQAALTARKFGEAAQAFDAALKLEPANADAAAGLKRAREGK